MKNFKLDMGILKMAQLSLFKKIFHTLFIWIIYNILALFGGTLISRNIQAVLGLLIFFNLVIVCYAIFVFSIKKLNKHFNIYNLEENYVYFEGNIIYRLILYTSFIPGFILITTPYNLPITGLGIGLAIFCPALIVFLRRNECFNEDSTNLNESKVYGYEPVYYMYYANLMSIFTIIFPFFALDVYSTSFINILIILFGIVIGLMITYNYLQPDKWNKRFNFENKTHEGFKKYTNIFFIISIIFGAGLIGILLII